MLGRSRWRRHRLCHGRSPKRLVKGYRDRVRARIRVRVGVRIGVGVGVSNRRYRGTSPLRPVRRWGSSRARDRDSFRATVRVSNRRYHGKSPLSHSTPPLPFGLGLEFVFVFVFVFGFGFGLGLGLGLGLRLGPNPNANPNQSAPPWRWPLDNCHHSPPG